MELYDELKEFSKALTAKFSAITGGQPEAQLRSPVAHLLTAYGKLADCEIVLKDEPAVEHIGRPDYAVEKNGQLVGYVELKEPEKGANTKRSCGIFLRKADSPNVSLLVDWVSLHNRRDVF